jgi:glycosyltransferase involved in cell wall biosynthesis
MKRVFVLAPNESWIVDRFVKEWRQDNPDLDATSPETADVIWLLSDWCWKQVPQNLLYAKRVLVTVHHIVPEKFGPRDRMEFEFRDRFVEAYHVPNEHTHSMVTGLTKKPIHVIPYWANNRIWQRTHEGQRLAELWEKHRLPPGFGTEAPTYFIGSFQRDTEGHDLISPKLEKGPDLLADAIITYRDRCKEKFPLEVILAGWRRQYLMNRLVEAGIKYHYFERPDQRTINELYQVLNLYPVTARHEGGPQSLIECGLLGIPVVSRDVGMASAVLPPTAINDNVTMATPCVPDVRSLVLPNGYLPFKNLLESL